MARRVTVGFLPLVDCAVLVAARERGFAREHGIELALVREPSWASLRDHLNLGYVDCAHALAPLPIASALGVGHVRVASAVPFVLGRGGNAITLSLQLFDEMCSAAGADLPLEPRAMGAALARVAANRPEPLTLGMVFPFSSHNFDLRYWLAAAGVHPDHDVRLVSIPPPLMVQSLRAGHIDGFCVGEPWNSLAVEQDLGRIVATKAQLMPHGVEKVLAVPPPLTADGSPLGALLEALAAAAAWADDAANAADLARLLAAPAYVGVASASIEAALRGRIALGGGEALHDPDFMYFHRHGANIPSEDEALWLYAQMVRWGQLPGSAADARAAASVFRLDLYRRYVDGAASGARVATPFDGAAFEPAELDAYLKRFALHTNYVSPAAARDD